MPVCSIFLQEGEETCILMWAKSLLVSILRRGRWEEYDLTPATFGKDVSPKLHGSSCDRTKARYLGPSRLIPVLTHPLRAQGLIETVVLVFQVGSELPGSSGPQQL